MSLPKSHNFSGYVNLFFVKLINYLIRNNVMFWLLHFSVIIRRSVRICTPSILKFVYEVLKLSGACSHNYSKSFTQTCFRVFFFRIQDVKWLFITCVVQFVNHLRKYTVSLFSLLTIIAGHILKKILRLVEVIKIISKYNYQFQFGSSYTLQKEVQ